MLFTYLFREPQYWIVPLLVQIVSYTKILKKMRKHPAHAIIPVLGEMEMSKDLFRRMRSFWRPAFVTTVLAATGFYLPSNSVYSIILKAMALTVYGVFLIRLYSRLAKQFGKEKWFAAGMVLLPLIFLPVLAFGKSRYLGKIVFPPGKKRSKFSKNLWQTIHALISGAEAFALIAVCFGMAMLIYPVRPLVKYTLGEDLEKIRKVEASDEIVGREDTLGADYMKAVDAARTRDYFFPDHSKDKKVVVIEYIIGADLEDSNGSATINIEQMKDVTGKGDGVEFVLQTGGSGRWFTDGIADESVGRYVVRDGKVEKEEDLDPTMCMSEPQNLTDFIVWAKENHPADRYMLALWDHGGGFSMGYGADELNRRQGETQLMTASEIINAVKDSGMKFDLIGFDACLMQNIEYANAFEPYADYYLASEESEPAYGWCYIPGFSALAEDPTLSTEEFGRLMVSSYDQLYRTMHDGEPQPKYTLSLVDLTLVKPAYQQLEQLYASATQAMPEDRAVFTNLSAARSGSYEFMDADQVDLIHFITNLKKADYKEEVASDEDLDKLVDSVKTCVVWRNKDSADGINGLAADYPYRDLSMYSGTYKEYKKVKYRKAEKFFNTFCSILAAQEPDKEQNDMMTALFGPSDYSDEDWYVSGFEDYDTSKVLVDIPVKETEDGYLPELPAKTWDTVLDCSVAAYMVTEDGNMYMGREHSDYWDDEDHPLVAMSDSWVGINGQLVCYETTQPLETEDGVVYSGTARALLNGKDDITIHIEWDPVSGEVPEEGMTGRVLGFSYDDRRDFFFMKKGLEQFEPGDRVEFIFDYYNDEGECIGTAPYGNPVIIVADEMLHVSDVPLGTGTELSYYGVLTDVYQRELMTEEIRERVE